LLLQKKSLVYISMDYKSLFSCAPCGKKTRRRTKKRKIKSKRKTYKKNKRGGHKRRNRYRVKRSRRGRRGGRKRRTRRGGTFSLIRDKAHLIDLIKKPMMAAASFVDPLQLYYPAAPTTTTTTTREKRIVVTTTKKKPKPTKPVKPKATAVVTSPTSYTLYDEVSKRNCIVKQLKCLQHDERIKKHPQQRSYCEKQKNKCLRKVKNRHGIH